jgi:thiol:disulfide interchange protein DsbD
MLLVLLALQRAMAQSNTDDLLPADQAFKLTLLVKNPQTLVADFTPAPGYYLYKAKTQFALKNATGVVIKEVRMPAGETKNDQFFGVQEIYTKPFQVEIALDRTLNAKGATLLAVYQGCNEKVGVCYPPIHKSLDFKLP